MNRLTGIWNWQSKNNMKKRPLCTGCLLLILFQLLLVLSGVRTMIPDLTGLEQLEGKTVSIAGQIYKKERQSDYQILYLKDTELSYQNQKIKKLNVILYDETFTGAAPGHSIAADGECGLFRAPGNPGNYDRKFYYAKQGITLYVWSRQIHRISGRRWRIRNTLAEIREDWHTLLCAALGEKEGGMLSAMLSGERRSMDDAWKELYQVNGIGHLLAISGLHVSFIGLSLYKILRKAGLSYIKSGGICILALTLYAAMTGFGVSTVRALLMFAIRVGADMTGRVYDIRTALSVAAAFIICERPLYLFDAGFLLSFGAILGILLLYPLLEELIPYRQKSIEALKGSLAIQLFLFPVTLYFFYELPLYSVLLNLIVIPLMSWLLGAGLAGSLLYCAVPAAGMWLLKSCHLIFRVYDFLCQRALTLPYARLVTGQPRIWQLIFSYTLLLLTAILFRERVGKHRAAVTFLLIGAMVITVPFSAAKDTLRITMIDVGQGDAFYVKGPGGSHYLIDGGSSDQKKIGKYCLEPFLKSQGVRTLDYAFVSHGDADHLNGVSEMLGRQETGVRIRTLVLPPKEVWDEHLTKLALKAIRCGTKVVIIREGEQLSEKGFTITCILPKRTYGGEAGNGASMVLLLRYGVFDMLMTGDVEGEGEKELEMMSFPGRIDVLKAAHHGSKNSTGEELLRRLRPTHTLLSAGIGNRYGHPHKETLERLKRNGSKVWNTQENGAVTIRTDGKQMRIEGYRK